MCNGVDPYQKVNLADQPLYLETKRGMQLNYHETLNRVEWLPATIECPEKYLKEYTENQPTRDKLIELISQ